MALAQRPDVFKVNSFITIISLRKLFVFNSESVHLKPNCSDAERVLI